MSETAALLLVLTLFLAVSADRVRCGGPAAPWQAPVEVEAEESTCSGKHVLRRVQCNDVSVPSATDGLGRCIQGAREQCQAYVENKELYFDHA